MASKILNLSRKYHKWGALIVSFFLLMFAVSGIIMNHRGITSAFDVRRSVLPDSYRLRNWNLASVKSSVTLSDGSRLIFGNSGIWKSDSLFSSFTDFNEGLDRGMDNRKVRSVVQLEDGTLLAGTFSGLYRRSPGEVSWEKIPLHASSERIQDIILNGSEVVVVTRSELITFSGSPDEKNARIIILKDPEGEERTISLFRLFWIIHSGEILGIAGRLLLDLLAFVIIFLVVTGLVHFFTPKLSQKIRNKIRNLHEFRRKNLRFHNLTGAWFFVLLLLVPFTGMFLRPPFLITIVNGTIPVPDISLIKKDNAWDDKLRAIAWSSELNGYILSTSEGFYFADHSFTDSLRYFAVQPPVSVMGINVFSPAGYDRFYVGSFDGLYLWHPVRGEVADLLPPQEEGRRRGSQQVLISGMITKDEEHILFDYDRGDLSEGISFPSMPENIKKASPMPLWNVAQEIHTGRIYQPLTGPFYILVVPLIAIFTLIVFITGYIRWRRLYRKSQVQS